MNQTISLSGNDTVVIGGRVLTDYADGDIATLEYPNELAKVKTGKNGNSIYAFDQTGRQCDLKIRVIRGSSDDRFLNGVIAQLMKAPESFVLLQSQLVKRVGDGAGNITNDTYKLGGGIPNRQVGASSNAEGNTDQSVAVYEFKFTNSTRAIM